MRRQVLDVRRKARDSNLELAHWESGLKSPGTLPPARMPCWPTTRTSDSPGRP